MSASAPAYGGGYPTDELQALMSGNWTSPPPNRLPSTIATAYQSSSFSHISTPNPSPQIPISPFSLGYSAGGSDASASISGPNQSSAPGFGSLSASALGPTLLLAAESATAAAPPVISGSDTIINSTSTSTPTPRPFSTLAGLARQQTQAFAALHSTFVSPHFFSTTAFAAHLPNIHLHNTPRLPNANDFFDHFATADLSQPPSFLQPPFFSPLQHRFCELHDLPQIHRHVGSSSAPLSTPTPPQFGLDLQAPNLVEEGLDLRRHLDDITHEEQNSSAENVQEQQEHEEEGDLQKDDQARIAVNSLLDDSMPAVSTSKKRTRATAALDETAGPATVKRPRSQSGGAGVSSKKPVRQPRTIPPVVNLDSDPFANEDDDEGKQELFDLTENDTLPEANKVEKEDTSTKLCKFECIICLDAASTLTVTHCGHMFCGPCLHQAMHAEVTKKICPMCRQKLDTRPKHAQPSKIAKTFFHLEMKLKLSKSQGKQPVRPARR